MREKETLSLFNDIAIFNQYLYMNEENYIEYDNGITTLKIRMNENCDYIAVNMAFPNLKPLLYSSDMTINFIRHIIETLKEKEPQIKNATFKNRWEEITEITRSNLWLNKIK